MMENNIDYLRLASALRFYARAGFEYRHLDWLVDEEFDDATRPQEARPVRVMGKNFVGSGEQSFLGLKSAGLLPPGRYVGLTPCFRDEATTGPLVRDYFMKVELIDTGDVSGESVKQMVALAAGYFTQYLKVEVVELGKDLYDINSVYGGVELGSYGMRRHSAYGAWVYGTGCAEPRLTEAVRMSRVLRSPQPASLTVDRPGETMWKIPRRARLDQYTPAEMAIYKAIQEVEAVGAHPLLTQAVILLGQARDKVADYVDMQPGNAAQSPTEGG